MNLTASLAQKASASAACSALNVSRAGFYRFRTLAEKKPSRRLPPLAFSCEERSEVIHVLHEDRFVDKAPQEIYAALLDHPKSCNTTCLMWHNPITYYN